MKSILASIFLIATTFSGLAQSATIPGVVKFESRYLKVLKDSKNDVDGYALFYRGDKLNKGENEYEIQLFDKNLTEVALKSFVGDKNLTFMQNSFNNQSLMFAMANYNDNKVALYSFDKQANPHPVINLQLKGSEMVWYERLLMMGEFNFLMPIENKGFLFNEISQNKSLGYKLKYFPTDGGQPWEYNSDEQSADWLLTNLIESTSETVVVLEYAKKGMLSMKADLSALVLDANSGKLLFKKAYNKKTNPRTISNAFINENSVILLGEYFAPDANLFKEKALGFFAEEIDLTGKTINESLVSWKDDVNKMLQETGNENISYMMFHDIVRVGNGDYYAIGEKYKKNSKGGGSVPVPGVSSGSIIITDAMFFKFDKNFKLIDITKFDKGKSEMLSLSSLMSPQVRASVAKALGGFDYGFTQVDPQNDRFYTIFLDSDRAGVKSKMIKTAYKAIVYDDGELSVDQITASSDANPKKTLRILPAKVGFLTFIEYDADEKQINIRLEKINIK